MVARYGVEAGYSEFWFMLIAQIGYLALIWWRGRRPPLLGEKS